MSTSTKRKVVSMIRVSTDRQAQDDKTGPVRQRREVKFTCDKFNLVVVKEFALEGITGIVVRKTKEFKELKAMLGRPDIVGLVIPSSDRLSRTTEFSEVA